LTAKVSDPKPNRSAPQWAAIDKK